MPGIRPLVLLVMLATACAREAAPPSVEGASSPSVAAPEATARAKRLDPRRGGFELGYGEFAITLEAQAIRPGPVTFVIHNGGTLTPGFEIEAERDGGSNRGPGGGDDEFKIESATFGPGDTIRVEANLPAGVYEVECFVANHDDLGMRAFLEVRKDAPLVTPTSVADNEVLIEGFAFNPGTIEVVGGTKVVWTNGDPAQHTVTAEDGAFGLDPIGQGRAFSFTFDEPGEYAYFCAFHPTMKGRVRVTG
jgi:plastocyanin